MDPVSDHYLLFRAPFKLPCQFGGGLDCSKSGESFVGFFGGVHNLSIQGADVHCARGTGWPHLRVYAVAAFGKQDHLMPTMKFDSPKAFRCKAQVDADRLKGGLNIDFATCVTCVVLIRLAASVVISYSGSCDPLSEDSLLPRRGGRPPYRNSLF